MTRWKRVSGAMVLAASVYAAPSTATESLSLQCFVSMTVNGNRLENVEWRIDIDPRASPFPMLRATAIGDMELLQVNEREIRFGSPSLSASFAQFIGAGQIDRITGTIVFTGAMRGRDPHYFVRGTCNRLSRRF